MFDVFITTSNWFILYVCLLLDLARLRRMWRTTGGWEVEVIVDFFFLHMKTSPSHLCGSNVFLETPLLVLPQILELLSSVFLNTFLVLVDIFLEFLLQYFVFLPELLQLLEIIVVQSRHLLRTSLVAATVHIKISSSSLLTSLLRELLLSLDMIFATHVVVERVLTGNFNQTQSAGEPLDLGRLLLVVGTFFVGLHLIPGSDPDIAWFTVELRLVELVLAMIIAIRVELGGDGIKSLSVQEPLLIRPQLLGPFFSVPEIWIIIVIVRDEDIVKTQSSSCLPDLIIFEPLQLHQMLSPLQMTHHGVSVIECHIAVFTM